MKRILFSLLFLATILVAKSQDKAMENMAAFTPSTAQQLKPGGEASPVMQVPCQGLLKPTASGKPWNRTLIKHEVEHEGPDAEALKKMKAEKFQLKYGAAKVAGGDGNKVASLVPSLGSSFSGNSYNGYYPPDNNMAISNGGYIVSVTNSSIHYTDASGTILYYDDFDNFLNDASLTSMLYDPVVFYDSGQDKFVMVVLHGTSSATSQVVVLFSKTNNPQDGWWYYKLSGNPLNDNSWFDYPKIAVSTHDVFITGNLFNGSTFNEAVVYQINKNSGFSGGSLSWNYWYNISGSPFTILPVSWGQQGNYGPGIYLVSNESFAGNTINLYSISDHLQGSPSMSYASISTNAYFAGADASQLGSTDALFTGDCRALSGFYLNGVIHYVFSGDIGSGWNGIHYNRVDVAGLSNQMTTFGLSGSYDYCYPAIASFSSTTTDPSVVIGFERSGPTVYPEIRVVTCDQNLNWSNSVSVKQGQGYVNVSSGSTERWGDYIGISRRHSASSPTVWMSAGYGSINNDYDTYIAEITSGAVGMAESDAKEKKVRVYPNPLVDEVRINFENEQRQKIKIGITTIDGRNVRVLLNDEVGKGEFTFTFNRLALPAGAYLVNVNSDAGPIWTEKIVVE